MLKKKDKKKLIIISGIAIIIIIALLFILHNLAAPYKMPFKLRERAPNPDLGNWFPTATSGQIAISIDPQEFHGSNDGIIVKYSGGALFTAMKYDSVEEAQDAFDTIYEVLKEDEQLTILKPRDQDNHRYSFFETKGKAGAFWTNDEFLINLEANNVKTLKQLALDTYLVEEWESTPFYLKPFLIK